MTASEQYADYATIRQVDLQRVATWMLLQIIADLETLQREILADITTIDPTGVIPFATQQRRLEQLLTAVNKKIEDAYQEMSDRTEGYFADLSDLEEEDQRKTFLLIFGLNWEQVTFDLGAMLILGTTLAGWFKRQAQNVQFRLSAALTEAVADGVELSDIIATVRGTPAGGFNDGILGPARNEAEMVVRTAADELPNAVSEELGEANAPVVVPTEPEAIRYGWQQISILDHRTTQICRLYADAKWDMHFQPLPPKNLPYDGGPPRHPYCRSRIVLILLDDTNGPTSFGSWMAKKSPAQQNAIFGAKKADQWRRGVLKDADLIRQRDRQLTLEEFRKRLGHGAAE